MKSYLQKPGVFIAAIVLALGLSLTSVRAVDKPQTFTGKVSDAMCGAKHMNGTPADCTRACVKQGSKYALVVGDKVYTLEASDKAALDNLDKLAGENAKVTGAPTGDTIQVSAVTAAQ